jgi:hypothetical protein
LLNWCGTEQVAMRAQTKITAVLALGAAVAVVLH